MTTQYFIVVTRRPVPPRYSRKKVASLRYTANNASKVIKIIGAMNARHSGRYEAYILPDDGHGSVDLLRVADKLNRRKQHGT